MDAGLAPVGASLNDENGLDGGADEVMLMVLCKMMDTLPGTKKETAK